MTHGARRPLPVPPRDRLPPPQTRLVHGAPIARAVARRRSQECTHAVLELGAVADAAGAVQLAVRRVAVGLGLLARRRLGHATTRRGAVTRRRRRLGCKPQPGQ